MLQKINYKDVMITVRGGAWLDVMNSCFYTVVDRVPGYQICVENGTDNVLFALPCID